MLVLRPVLLSSCCQLRCAPSCSWWLCMCSGVRFLGSGSLSTTLCLQICSSLPRRSGSVVSVGSVPASSFSLGPSCQRSGLSESPGVCVAVASLINIRVNMKNAFLSCPACSSSLSLLFLGLALQVSLAWPWSPAGPAGPVCTCCCLAPPAFSFLCFTLSALEWMYSTRLIHK